MSLSAISISNYVPTIRIASPEQIARNLRIIAIPAITLFAASMITGAQAIGYVECINNCNAHRDAHAIAKLACYALCAIFAKD